MIIVIKQGSDERKVANLINWIESLNIEVYRVTGKDQLILALSSHLSRDDEDLVEGLDIVQAVRHISEPYKILKML